jgi:5-hydroxyisourate hydrolase-like protein (transthyretin family)
LHEFIPATDSTAGSTRTQTAKLKAATQSNWVSTARVGVSTVLSGELNPPQALVKVELQQKSAFSWKTVATSTSTNSGTWSFGYISQSAGLKTFRVKATNSKNSVNTISKSITFKSKVTLFGTTKAKVSSTVALNGSTIPARAGLTVIIERKVGTGIWKRVATTTTDDSGSWSLQGRTTSYAVTTRFRARLSDAKIGQATSKILRITVNK